ncbi:type II CAAX prenyl endopeptidase Rce1 family protein [Chamaesiphon minutus]|uniref:Putative protease of the Abi (CAAX) family n=1 Tax=Chamaesiphon minutus (strain ATCC 27169 / PCC 6605) TaxID=1173020 RepID=K9ULY0_CHAP6|nr:CPBP family glutamic-type intramembrane protease [Chamaesiphon minutus]AFY95204.1 putative protease of the Abi (CAAX) family [Chamaesiphon minutus PCC 6605]
MKKARFWQLIGACAIGICWGWWCHNAILANILPPHLPAPVTIATTLNLPESIGDSSPNLNYRPNGEWIGRLILPSQEDIKTSAPGDWVWVEIKNAPETARQTIGKTLRLTWQPQSKIAADARQVTTDIKFTAGTIASQQQGNIHPQRLNGRFVVGALQSLAGARAEDDVLVRLDGANLNAESGSTAQILTMDREPIQIASTLTGLVQILGTDNSRQPACSGNSGCQNEYFRVRHYNLKSHSFNGQMETIRIPQMPAQPSGLLPSTIRDLERSPAGSQGWYIYGDRDRQNLFTVAAIQPRALFTLTPHQETTDTNAKLDYLNSQHWQNISQSKGKLSQVKFRGLSSEHPTEQLGDRALLIHLFGGIGGKTGDTPGVWQTVTGHFAYGIAHVTRSTFTGELEWNVEYNQVYAHNPNGIIAGKQDWATYMGHLQRGWLGTRPVSDLLISYPPVTADYDFGGIKLSPLTELQRQLNIFAARYRAGDGTGNASVTPATSCVQDANQALYITIRQLNRQVSTQPQIQSWLAAHPQHLQTLRFRELQSLGAELETTLAPLGIVRQDWQQNAAKLAGIDSARGFSSSTNPLAGLVSWRTMLPRGAQDGIAKIFNSRSATMWFLNTYQVGGVNLDIIPIAPTILFGQIPILATLVVRIWAGLITIPSSSEWLLGLCLLISYAAIALSIGFKSGFLSFHAFAPKLGSRLWQQMRSWMSLFFMPALVEEMLFRLLLIPHPIETASVPNIWIWSLISLILFLFYHPFNALTFYKLGNPTFMNWRFLTLAGLLGLVCTIAYLTTGSIWIPIIIHWLIVSSWLDFFGGNRHLESKL